MDAEGPSLRRLALCVMVCSAVTVGSCSAGPTRPGGASTDPSAASPADPSGAPDLSREDPDGTAPDVVGSSLAKARPVLKARGLAITVEFRHSSRPAGTILRQTILPGTDVHPRAIVVLLVARAAGP
jgi:beta-lactam-binding protein with PASTA domain